MNHFSLRSLLSFPILVGLMAFILSSCKNDLKLNAPYKEMPTVYAVLNPKDKIHMIRVNKVFLGEGDTYQMAKIADSVNYKPDEITVSLKHSSNPNNTIYFRDSIVQTVDGAFNSTQRVYVDTTKLMTTGTYTLTIKNNHTGNVFTAKSAAVQAVSETQGFGDLSGPYYPNYPPATPEKNYIDYSSRLGAVHFAPIAGNTKIYQLVIRVHFNDDLGTSGSRTDYVDLEFSNRYPKDVAINTGLISTSFNPEFFFSGIGTALSKKNLSNNVLGRKVWLIEYQIFSSTQEYLDYLEYSKPSFGFNQNKPLYSNFDNGAAIGIFTFRTNTSIKKEMTQSFISAFSDNPHTCQYKFYDVNNNLRGCK
jgi:hypothetical protein